MRGSSSPLTLRTRRLRVTSQRDERSRTRRALRRRAERMAIGDPMIGARLASLPRVALGGSSALAPGHGAPSSRACTPAARLGGT